MITAVDTNVLIDVISGTPEQIRQNETALRNALAEGNVLIALICYAELAGRFPQKRDLDIFLDLTGAAVTPIEPEAAYLAGRFFREYLQRGGPRTRILPDFLVAAHAQLHANRLLTRDKRFFSTTFPKLKAVSPADLA